MFDQAKTGMCLVNNTYLLTPWCKVLLATGLQLVKKFPVFHGTRRFITALTSVRHLSLSWARPIQSIYPHTTSWRSILILSTHLRLGLPIGLFPSGFPTKTLYTPLSSTIRATCPAHLIPFDFITRKILGEEYKTFRSSLCNLLHSPVTSPLIGPNRNRHSKSRGRDAVWNVVKSQNTEVKMRASFTVSEHIGGINCTIWIGGSLAYNSG